MAASGKIRQGDKTGTAKPAVSEEIELKFTLPPARLKQLAEHGLPDIKAAAPRAVKLISRYYDTPDRLLWQNGIALRVRNKGDQWLQHLKWRGSDKGFAGGSRRQEWEWSLNDAEPRPEILDLAFGDSITLPLEWHRSLEPVFETDITRHIQNIDLNGTLIEIAYDHGVLRAGAAEQVLAEVELELKKGDENTLYRLAEILVTASGARLAGGSKAEQGYRLADGRYPVVQKAKPAQLSPTDSAATALARQAGRTLGDLLANQFVVFADSSPEGVHQMRVSLRRLDAITRPLRAQLEASPCGTLLTELKWLRGKLGSLRNWDVFLSETLPDLRHCHMDDEDNIADYLQPAADACRREARARLISALNDQRYADLLLRLTQLATGQTRLPNTMQQEFRAIGSRWLIEQLDRMDRRGQRLHSLKPRRQHRFRLKVKKTRYVADIVSELTGTSHLKTATKAMAKLQDKLGQQNDMFTAIDLLGRLSEHASLRGNQDAETALGEQQAIWRTALEHADPKLTKRWQKVRRKADDWIIDPSH